MQKTVGGNEFDMAMLRPTTKQSLQNAGGGAFSYRNAASDTDNIGNSLTIGAKKLFENSLATQVRTDIEVEQTRQRQIDLGNLFQREIFVDAFNRVISSSVNVIGTESRSAAHWWRLNCRYGVINVCSFWLISMFLLSPNTLKR